MEKILKFLKKLIAKLGKKIIFLLLNFQIIISKIIDYSFRKVNFSTKFWKQYKDFL
jgi:hypothetical protein